MNEKASLALLDASWGPMKKSYPSVNHLELHHRDTHRAMDRFVTEV
jgi:hypothetical protein